MVLRNRIQEEMWIKHISQEELSKLTGIKQSYLSEIISKGVDVRISTAKKFARALGKSVDYLWPD
ncbi:MAG: helix-turn-helix domain-containing protein [Desulfitobacteriaceae bacterium]